MCIKKNTDQASPFTKHCWSDCTDGWIKSLFVCSFVNRQEGRKTLVNQNLRNWSGTQGRRLFKKKEHKRNRKEWSPLLYFLKCQSLIFPFWHLTLLPNVFVCLFSIRFGYNCQRLYSLWKWQSLPNFLQLGEKLSKLKPKQCHSHDGKPISPSFWVWVRKLFSRSYSTHQAWCVIHLLKERVYWATVTMWSYNVLGKRFCLLLTEEKINLFIQIQFNLSLASPFTSGTVRNSEADVQFCQLHQTLTINYNLQFSIIISVCIGWVWYWGSNLLICHPYPTLVQLTVQNFGQQKIGCNMIY